MHASVMPPFSSACSSCLGNAGRGGESFNLPAKTSLMVSLWLLLNEKVCAIFAATPIPRILEESISLSNGERKA